MPWQKVSGAMDNAVSKIGEVLSKKDDDDTGNDKFQAITGLDYKREPPKIRDDDPDLDKLDLAFDTMVACYSVGRKKLREVDKLHMYGASFAEGTTRRKVYDNALRRATNRDRIPGDAKELLVEIRKELRTYIWETPMQKMVRLDKEFESLEQGGLSHADFRALWVSKLQDMEESMMDMPTPQTLYRKYLTKLNPDLRVRVLSKEWKIDGEDMPARMPATHEEDRKSVV